MICTEIEPLLYLYKPGELSESEQIVLEKHLKTCKDCRKHRDELRNDSLKLNELIGNNYEYIQADFYKNRIFEKLNYQLVAKSENISGKIYRRSLYYFSSSIFRRVSAAIIAGFILTFLFQNYSAYIQLSQLELKFGNASGYEFNDETKAISFGKDDLRFIKESSQKGTKNGYIQNKFGLIKGNQLLLMSIRKHRFYQELANHNPGIDPAEILRILNKSLYLVESKRSKN